MSDPSIEAGDSLAGDEAPPASVLTIRREYGDVFVGAALLALAFWFFVTASRIDDYSGDAIGAADFPQGIALLLGAGALVIVVGAVRRMISASERHGVTIRRYRHVAIGMLLLISFPVLMQAVGYYFAMAPWLAAFLVLAGERRPIHVVAYVVGFLLFTKVIFEIVLGTPLP